MDKVAVQCGRYQVQTTKKYISNPSNPRLQILTLKKREREIISSVPDLSNQISKRWSYYQLEQTLPWKKKKEVNSSFWEKFALIFTVWRLNPQDLWKRTHFYYQSRSRRKGTTTNLLKITKTLLNLLKLIRKIAEKRSKEHTFAVLLLDPRPN